jgi:hypothetical protein
VSGGKTVGQSAREERLAGARRANQQRVVDDFVPALDTRYTVVVGRS